MTIETYQSVLRLVDEIGKDNIEAIFEYVHTITKKTLYAVFTKGTYVDVYQSPFCSCIKLLFQRGIWLDQKLLNKALYKAITGEEYE